MKTKNVLIFAAVGEVTTGLALLFVPSLTGQLLFGQHFTGVAIPVARVTGIALIALGAACWPGPAVAGMLIYSGLVTLYLAYLGVAGGLTGILLWPAVVLHFVLIALLFFGSRPNIQRLKLLANNRRLMTRMRLAFVCLRAGRSHPQPRSPRTRCC